MGPGLKRFQWIIILVCDIEIILGIFLVKNVVAFCPCLNSLPEAKVKKFRLIALTKEISKQLV